MIEGYSDPLVEETLPKANVLPSSSETSRIGLPDGTMITEWYSVVPVLGLTSVTSGLTYVQARERADVHPVFTEINPETGTTKYRSLIIVPADSDIEEVEDIEGQTFAFGSVSSTSGSLYPSIMLDQAGIDYRTDLEEVIYTGGHDATAQAVANGRVAAGGLEDRILYDLQEEGIVEEGSVRVIEESEPIEGYPWVVRDDLPDETEQEITDAFLGIEDPELLDLLRAEGYERVEAADYDYVEEQARKLDLLTEQPQ